MDMKAVSAIQNFTNARSNAAVESYRLAKPATDPMPKTEDVVDGVKSAVADFAATLSMSEQTAKQAMIGDADPHALVQALAQTELAVETAVSVRNRVVEAYQEILRMPV